MTETQRAQLNLAQSKALSLMALIEHKLDGAELSEFSSVVELLGKALRGEGERKAAA